MTNNYFKIRQFKKDILVFFDDDKEHSIFNAFAKIQALNTNDNVISVWMVPEIAGPWNKCVSIK